MNEASNLRPSPPRWALWSALLFAVIFPTAISWVEYLGAAPEGGRLNVGTPIAYGGGKMVQFAWPLLCFWMWERRLPRLERPHFRGAALGVSFGLVVGAGALGLYFGWLRDTVLFAQASVKIHGRLGELGLNSPAGFALFAFFIAVLHSLLEEYYWRWFLFGWLRRVVAVPLAIVLSSVAFMFPHVYALATFLGAEHVTAIMVFTLCTGAGGAAWAWLYQQSGSLYAPWLSHLLVDAALFVVGYDLFFVRAV
jgi:membrane protease YdiL (CAAX protease family)